MQLAELGPAAGGPEQPAAPAGLVDQLPRGMALGVLEGRAAGLFADRLGLLAPAGDLVDAGLHRRRIARRPAERGLDPDDVRRGLRVAVGVAEVRQLVVNALAGAR